jgi:thioester reductase-like protein
MSTTCHQSPPLLLTGATGVLGARLLLELLRQQKREVYCLIRAQDAAHARQRILKAVSVYAAHRPLEEEESRRIIPVVGDLSLPELGLEKKVYRQVLINVSQVISVAANVNLAGMYPELEKINVRGVRHIVDFCLKAGVPLLHTSSYSVAGLKAFDAEVVFREDDFDIGQQFDLYFYPKSKFEGERVIRQAADRGLQFTIARPGNIFGDSETGAYPLKETTVSGIYYNILKTVADCGITLFSEGWADITPVDYVAKALSIMSTEPFASETYHLLNPDRKCFYDLTNHLTDYGYRIKTFPMKKFFDFFKEGKVRVNGQPYESGFAQMGTIFRNYFETAQMKAAYGTRKTVDFLQSRGLVCPPNDQKLMATYIDYCIQENYLNGPRNQEKVEIL